MHMYVLATTIFYLESYWFVIFIQSSEWKLLSFSQDGREKKHEDIWLLLWNILVWLQEDLTVSLLEKCKQSQVVIQRIIESTSDDEAMLFEALNLHDELQQVISQYEVLEAGLNSGEQLPGGSGSTKEELRAQVGHNEAKMTDPIKGENENESSSNKKNAEWKAGIWKVGFVQVSIDFL